MKEINKNTIEEAILMYKENVSPSRKNLEMILSQIPEQKTKSNLVQPNKVKEARAIRSPYIWIAITEMVTLCSIMFALYPTLKVEMYDAKINQEFNIIDTQNDEFQLYMDTTDFDEPTI